MRFETSASRSPPHRASHFAREFQLLACHVVDVAHAIDVEKALLIVERPHKHLQSANCQEMAAGSDDKVAINSLYWEINADFSRHANVSNVDRPAMVARTSSVVAARRQFAYSNPP